eukprot:235431-Hanusia_phi.AAC.2
MGRTGHSIAIRGEEARIEAKQTKQQTRTGEEGEREGRGMRRRMIMTRRRRRRRRQGSGEDERRKGRSGKQATNLPGQ